MRSQIVVARAAVVKADGTTNRNTRCIIFFRILVSRMCPLTVGWQTLSTSESRDALNVEEMMGRCHGYFSSRCYHVRSPIQERSVAIIAAVMLQACVLSRRMFQSFLLKSKMKAEQLSLEMLHAILPNNLHRLQMNDSFMRSAGFGRRKGSRVNFFVYAPNLGWADCSIIDRMGGHAPLFYRTPFLYPPTR